jgi:23S rRNA (guanosine2251-2'-O)-methyltransferase
MKRGQNPEYLGTKRPTRVILSDIRSVHNVGSIFRTADAAGVKKIYLTGLTPTPVDRFGRKRKDFAKVSLGAEEFVSWEYVDDTPLLLERLKCEGAQLVAVEQDASAIDYRRFKPQYPVAFIFGNEVDGLSEDVIRACDAVIEIPMRGTKESLNVSVVAGIILFNF